MPNKPTTLRESLLQEVWERIPDDLTGQVLYYRTQIEPHIARAIDKCLTSHNTELVSKIEGMRQTEKTKSEKWSYNQALDEVINIINQEN